MSNKRTILDYLEDISGATLDIHSFIQGMSADGIEIGNQVNNACVCLGKNKRKKKEPVPFFL